MNLKRNGCFLVTFFFILNSANLKAQEAGQPEEKVSLRQNASITQHNVEIAGNILQYTATAGTIPLSDENGKTLANVFFVAYTKDGVKDVSQRPLLFSFNGGPGAASVWLHLGLLGPRRVLLDDKGFGLPPPYKLVNNEYSILDVADLVFIDPVSTGYSRAVSDIDPKQFHGFTEDIESVGEFIRLYITRYKRWDSPKFLIGESYGARRACGRPIRTSSRQCGNVLKRNHTRIYGKDGNRLC